MTLQQVAGAARTSRIREGETEQGILWLRIDLSIQRPHDALAASSTPHSAGACSLPVVWAKGMFIGATLAVSWAATVPPSRTRSPTGIRLAANDFYYGQEVAESGDQPLRIVDA